VIVDSSALIAVLRGEADANRYVDALAAARGARMSAPTYMETAAVVDGSRDPVLSRRLEELISTADIESVHPRAGRIAREAYRDFGRGSGHPARLNLGDCFPHALARSTGQPLLFKG